MKKLLVNIAFCFSFILLTCCGNRIAATIKHDVPIFEAPRIIEFSQPQKRRWWHDVVTYEIWPRSFYDVDGDGNGDIKGMAAKLPYLKQLGVGALWLTPIFESPSYHGYDVSDFYSIESDYGSMADFEEFLKQAKILGIKTIVDLVINHVSDQHEWFIKSANKEPGFENYFVWRKTQPDNYGNPWGDVPSLNSVWFYNETRKEWYYSVFGKTQPDLNLQNPVVAVEIKKIAAFWLKKGVDGFRLDAVRYYIEEGGLPLQADTQGTFNFLADFNFFVKSENPDAMLVGEVFADAKKIASYYQNGKGIDMAFDFDFALTVVNSLSVNDAEFDASPEHKKTSVVREAFWNNLQRRNTAVAPGYFFAPFVHNHDVNRLMGKFNGNVVRTKIAASLLLTSPGAPYVYYGEEIGMSQSAVNDDMYRRGLMQWDSSSNAGFNLTGRRWLDEAKWFPWQTQFSAWWENDWSVVKKMEHFTVVGQDKDEYSLLALYKKLIALRNNDIIIRSPEKVHLYGDTANAWVVKYTRGNSCRWIILNLDPEKGTLFTLPAALIGKVRDVLTGDVMVFDESLSLTAGELLVLTSGE